MDAALALLQGLSAAGVRHWVVCPGSRSAPLASAVGLLVQRGWGRLHTAIDERSAAFFGLGLGRASGQPAAVITTSGSAVANLLPAVVEADYGCIPLLLLTADRPLRLKGCGANQTVNQDAFLVANVRWFDQAGPDGLAALAGGRLRSLAETAVRHCRGTNGQPPGAVHLNLPFEEPLHAPAQVLRERAAALAALPAPPPLETGAPPPPSSPAPANVLGWGGLDPDRPGLVVAGPWRGNPQAWPGYVAALRRWQQRSGWPVLADGLSGLRGCDQLELVASYDLVAPRLPHDLAQALPQLQVLRLGPLPASRRLLELLQACGGPQLLVSEGDPRPLDPLARCRGPWSGGLAAWLAQLPQPVAMGSPATSNLRLAASWRGLEQRLQALLDQQLLAPAAWGEPAIARQLERWLPAHLPLVIANSSPVRDWESFTAPVGRPRAIHACRGASGIDGTLSVACGVAEALGQAVLLTGDLALLHDSNGWLWHSQLSGRLLVVLIDNGGGGIFEQLPIRPAAAAPLDFERLFAMPQALNHAALAAAHGVPSRDVPSLAELEPALAWGLEQPMALLVLRTDRRADAAWRQALRRMACSSVDSP
ncbi:MAG: 2-succinyl-5-enolpyruvyl-6-hydroxy-3-cyclohexene-1-carboxylic-acid synthase [Cyanobacteria bacterium]|nr:2-succinyl-5-enolpyruvyl-6-hydroxy-3-cyclohexene-1-carboxylic-acid synthase [Cyanobacteriota bacterium]